MYCMDMTGSIGLLRLGWFVLLLHNYAPMIQTGGHHAGF